MWRLSYSLIRAAMRLQYWLQRRFSTAGMFLLGLLTVTGALGIDTQQTLAYQVFAFTAALLAVAMVATLFRRVPVTVERSLPRTVAAGTTFTYRIRIRNTGTRPLAGLALLDRIADHSPGFAEFRRRLRFPTYRGFWRLWRERRVGWIEEAAVSPLAPGAEAEVKVEAHAVKRGIMNLDEIVVARTDPAGLFRSVLRLAQPANIVVLPRRYPLPPISLPGARCYQPGGVSLSASVGDSGEFLGLRDYRPGDALPRIHWKSFARTGRPIVREYQDEFFERYALALDTCAKPSTNRKQDAVQLAAFEEAVAVTASFVWTLDTQECLLDLLFVEDRAYCYTAGRGQLQPAGLLEVLAGVRLTHEPSLDTLRDSIAARRGELSGCVLVLIDWDAERAALVDGLRAAGMELRVIVVNALPELAPPAGVAQLDPGDMEAGLARL